MMTIEKTRGGKAGIFTALAVALILVLSACGATVNTSLDLSKDGSGTRVISAKISTDDLSEYAKGGLKAIDASLKKNTPDELKYKGLKENKKDSEATATFEMSFSSFDDYESKVNSLLTASGSDLTAEINTVIEDNEFVSGFATKENFGSSELLGWAEEGLVSDGVVSEDNSGSIFSDGEVTVKFEGKKYDSSSSQVLVDEVKDYGFESIEVNTTVNSDNTFAQEVTYQINSEKAEKLGDKLKKFMESATVDGSLEDYYGPSGTTGYQQNFLAADAAELAAKTGKALGSEKVSYTYEFGSTGSNPLATIGTLSAELDCETVCSPSGQGVKSQVSFPADYVSGEASQGISSTSNEGLLQFTPETASYSVSAQHSLPLDSAKVDTTVGLDRSVSQTYTFTLSSETDTMVGEGFNSFLAPDEGLGTLERSEVDAGVDYVLKVSAASAQDLNAKLSNIVAGAGIQLSYPEEFQLFPEYFFSQSWDPGTQLGDVPVTNGVSSSVNLPLWHKFTAGFDFGENQQVDGSTLNVSNAAGVDINVSAKGPTTSTFIIFGAILVAMLIAAALIFIFRKRIGKVGKNAWDRRDEAIAAGKKAATGVASAGAAAAAGVSAAAGAGMAAANSASAEGTALATKSQEFSEADLI